MNFSEIKQRNDEFVRRFVAAFPQLAPMLNEHEEYFEEILASNFMSDVARYVVDTYVKAKEQGQDIGGLRRMFDFLESGYATGDDVTQELLNDSFIEMLPFPWEKDWPPHAEEVCDLLGPTMAAERRRQLGPASKDG